MVVTLDARTLSDIRSLKETNNHGEAYRTAAKALGLTELAEKFERINREQDRFGDLTDNLYVERRAAYESLLKEARQLLSKEQYDKLYMCF